MKKDIFTAIFLAFIFLLNFNCQKPNGSQRTDSSTVTILYPYDERILAPYYDVDAKFLVFLPLYYKKNVIKRDFKSK